MISEMFRDESRVERRQHERFPMMIDATASLESGPCKATIFDLSAGGAKVKVPGGIDETSADEGSSIDIAIQNFGVFQGTIIWIDDEFVGVEFSENHKAMVALILDAHE